MTATIHNGDITEKPHDLKVVHGSEIYLNLNPKSHLEYAIFCKCSSCGYVFRESDYWRRRGGWARGKVEKLMRRCIKCGHGKYYSQRSHWTVQVECIKKNQLDAVIQLMGIAELSDKRKVKNPYKLFLGPSFFRKTI